MRERPINLGPLSIVLCVVWLATKKLPFNLGIVLSILFARPSRPPGGAGGRPADPAGGRPAAPARWGVRGRRVVWGLKVCVCVHGLSVLAWVGVGGGGSCQWVVVAVAGGRGEGGWLAQLQHTLAGRQEQTNPLLMMAADPHRDQGRPRCRQAHRQGPPAPPARPRNGVRLFAESMPLLHHLGVRPRGYLGICWDMIGYDRIC